MRTTFFIPQSALAYSPSTDPYVMEWFKADALSLTDGAAVSTWTALIGTNATVPGGKTAATFKTNIKNSLPIVRFGSNNCLAATTPTYNHPLQLFVVFKASSTTPTNVIIGFKGNSPAGGTDSLAIVSASPNKFRWSAGSLTANNQDFANADTNWHIMLLEDNGASARYKIDNGALTTFASDAGSNDGIGVAFAGALNSATDIGEAIIRVNIEDPDPVFSYLNGRWAIY